MHTSLQPILKGHDAMYVRSSSSSDSGLSRLNMLLSLRDVRPSKFRDPVAWTNEFETRFKVFLQPYLAKYPAHLVGDLQTFALELAQPAMLHFANADRPRNAPKWNPPGNLSFLDFKQHYIALLRR
ncbi:hypothetical protein SPRG_06388 [Saprolegnia parasitica CBS 223.65]|uniref:Uncharacterized protein n=1 Tax=Saprolegnia parasitica (strain CBS 223.65) TaxID=695850 RepID=A0A067CH66_SAPPC|nr:hypothetical protein SPRG_06388 [Saprolegnia parasitica CBS 223.65]KDO28530.1 hypothetical protein SPRG_06388 [Saprolegnia parasitica CBS 223.65]|eukprot:XP_012200596.1 hypothetical protein SPRG_06388 [Saprolegnia parasitica CBS 223.65]